MVCIEIVRIFKYVLMKYLNKRDKKIEISSGIFGYYFRVLYFDD